MKQKNPDVGTCACPMCQRPAPVRRNSSGKLYLVCDHRAAGGGGCGMLTPNLNGGQAWIAERLQPVTAAPAAAPEAAPVTDTETGKTANGNGNGNIRPAASQEPGIFASIMKVRLL